MIISFIIVGIGGALGAMLRYAVQLGVSSFALGPAWLATFVVNLAGALVMGVMAGWLLGTAALPEGWRLFIMVGLLGALTTFSSFTLDSYHLLQRQEWLILSFYVLGSVILSYGCFLLGLWLCQQLLRASGGGL